MRLSLNENQRCWKEEVPNFGMTGFIDKRRNEYCDGYLKRGGETIDYILYLRTDFIKVGPAVLIEWFVIKATPCAHSAGAAQEICTCGQRA